VECTINGIGERAGNAALEEIAAALYVRGDRYGVTTGIKLDQLYPTSQVLGQIITFKPSPNKAIVGDNAFAHESGIHQHGMLANPLCYEIMTPPWWAWPRRTWCWASTPAARRCAIGWSSSASRSPARNCSTTYYRFVALADRKKNIYDQDLIGLLPDQIRERRREPVSELD
jgi:2-isopropylmalate synthase